MLSYLCISWNVIVFFLTLGYLPSVIFKTTWILFKCINVTASILHNTRIMMKFPILYDFS